MADLQIFSSVGLAAAQFVALVIGGVWAVSKVRTTTELLRLTISDLSRTNGRLEKTIEKIESQVMAHEHRLIRLEMQNESARSAQ